jgi:cell division transport system ATP-binding protein
MMVSLKQVSKAYHPNSLVLRNVNIELKKGEFLFVVGDSGAGKTSLLKLITGEEFASDGAVAIDGVRFAPGSGAMLKLRRCIGVVHQDYRLLKDRTVYENVAIPLFFGRAGMGLSPVSFMGRGAEKLVEDAISAVGLRPQILDATVRELSGGEQQRVAIARAIINAPDLLIADEPTGALDHEHTWTVMDLFQKLNIKGMTMLVATHDRDIIRKVRKRTLHLSGGTVRVDDREGACIF